MSDAESRYEDAKRERYEEKQEAVIPEPCGCEFLSGCCGRLPSEATPDVGKDSLTGICDGCNDHSYDYNDGRYVDYIYTVPSDYYDEVLTKPAHTLQKTI